VSANLTPTPARTFFSVDKWTPALTPTLTPTFFGVDISTPTLTPLYLLSENLTPTPTRTFFGVDISTPTATLTPNILVSVASLIQTGAEYVIRRVVSFRE
jgi:hypothetical protein